MSNKEALLELVQGPDGALWQKNHEGWDSEAEDVCDWSGIKCTDDGAIYEINVESSRLTSSIPASLGSIASLTHLYLGSNNMFGEVPTSVARLPNLVHVDLSRNSYRGTVPIFTSPSLEVLNLSHNSFHGELPIDFGTRLSSASNLRVIDLKYNRIGGTIPSTVGEVSSSLLELDLSSNKLYGGIPDGIGNLEQLEGLFLSNNRLSGPIPSTLSQNMRSLSQVFLQGNELSGPLPPSLSELPSLTNLFIDDNKITGVVPPDLCSKDLNAVFFQSSSKMEIRGGDSDFDDDAEPAVEGEAYDEEVLALDGAENNGVTSVSVGGARIPVVHEESGSRRLAVDPRRSSESDCSDDGCVRNGCNSVACPAGYRSVGDGKDGVFPCAKCLHDHVNPYIGSSRCFVLDQYAILSKFYADANGPDWIGSYGMWTDTRQPVCSWTGVACNNNGDVVSLVLPNSNLKGPIAPDLGFLRHLEILDLSDNFLTGEIPGDLRFAPLDVLDVSGNQLEGVVPAGLCEMERVNGNGKDGVFTCEKIACPFGTYSATGRGGGKDGECVPCAKGSDFLAMKVCGPQLVASQIGSGSGSDPKTVGAIVGVILVSLLTNLFLCCGFMLFRRRRQMIKDIERMHDGDFVDPEDEIPMSYMSKTQPPPSDQIQRGTFVEPDAFPTSVQVNKARNAWSSGKESQREVWLDVPKIN